MSQKCGKNEENSKKLYTALNYTFYVAGNAAMKFLQCPKCGSVKCEIIVEPERRFNWGKMLNLEHSYVPWTKQVLQQKGHCLECGCIW